MSDKLADGRSFRILTVEDQLRDECLNVEWFVSLADARKKLAKFVPITITNGPHSSLADRTPAAFAELHRQLTEKTSTSMRRAVQSLFIESMDRDATRIKSGDTDC